MFLLFIFSSLLYRQLIKKSNIVFNTISTVTNDEMASLSTSEIQGRIKIVGGAALCGGGGLFLKK